MGPGKANPKLTQQSQRAVRKVEASIPDGVSRDGGGIAAVQRRRDETARRLLHGCESEAVSTPTGIKKHGTELCVDENHRHTGKTIQTDRHLPAKIYTGT